MNPFFTSSSAYSWWYGASGGSKNPSHLAAITNQQFDNKLARISFQLAGLLVRDRIGRDFSHSDPETRFLNMKIKLFDYTSVGMEGDILNLLESLGLKVEHIKSFDAASHLIQNKLPLDCIVILNGMFQPQQKDILQAFLNFVTEGGRMIILNCASIVTASLFHTKMQPAPASTTVRAPIHIRAEKDLFTGFDAEEELELEYFRYPIDVIDSRDTKVLAMIRSWRDEPLLVKSKVGVGVVYVFVSKLFTIQKTIEDFTDWLVKKGASQATLTAWQCALKVGYKDAALHAISTCPMMEALGKIIWKEYDHISATSTSENGHQEPEQQSEM